eukprot:1540557-Pyramimonas_sp.AAC.1
MSVIQTCGYTRGISLLSAMGKWYMACLLIFVEEHGHIKKLATYGFQKSHKVHHMTAPILNMKRHATLWGKGGRYIWG